MRDPKVNPEPSDRFLRWHTVVRVTHVIQGCVYISPSLTTDGWIGIQFFRDWAAQAEVVDAGIPADSRL
jgi:hypothetical protein